MAEQFQAIPLKTPEFVSPTFERPDATTVSVIRNRGAWTTNTVYNVNDFATFIGDGSYNLIVCLEPHTSGDTFDPSKWSVIVDFFRVTGGIDSTILLRVEALEQAIEDGDFGQIDGSETLLLLKRFTDAELLAFPSQIPEQGEFWYRTDTSPPKLALGDGIQSFNDLSNLLLLDISEGLEELLADAQLAASESEIAMELARQWAAASPGVPIEPGLESARAERIKIQALLRTLSAFPTRTITGTSGQLIKTSDSVVGDEFRQVFFRNTTPAEFECPRDWNLTKAVDGSDGLVACKVWNLGSSTVEITGQTGTEVLPITGITATVTTHRDVTEPPPAPPDKIVNVTMAAGEKRIIYVSTFELSYSSAPHEVSLSSSVGSVAVLAGPSAPTGDYNTGARVNAKSFLVTLPDSATPTPVTLTFDLPVLCLTFSARLRLFINVDATSDASAESHTAPALSCTGTVTPQANSVCCFDFANPGNRLPILNITGFDTINTAFATGSTNHKDHSFWGGYKGGASVANRTASGDLSTAATDPKQWAFLGVSLDPATTGGAAVEIVGDVMVPTDKAVLIEALSDGRTFYLSGGDP